MERNENDNAIEQDSSEPERKSLSDIIEFYRKQQHMQGEHVTQCESCESRPRGVKCHECCIFLCENCANGHRKLPMCKTHYFIKVEDCYAENRQQVDAVARKYGKMLEMLKDTHKRWVNYSNSLSEQSEAVFRQIDNSEQYLHTVVTQVHDSLRHNVRTVVCRESNHVTKNEPHIAAATATMATDNELVQSILQEKKWCMFLDREAVDHVVQHLDERCDYFSTTAHARPPPEPIKIALAQPGNLVALLQEVKIQVTKGVSNTSLSNSYTQNIHKPHTPSKNCANSQDKENTREEQFNPDHPTERNTLYPETEQHKLLVNSAFMPSQLFSEREETTVPNPRYSELGGQPNMSTMEFMNTPEKTVSRTFADSKVTIPALKQTQEVRFGLHRSGTSLHSDAISQNSSKETKRSNSLSALKSNGVHGNVDKLGNGSFLKANCAKPKLKQKPIITPKTAPKPKLLRAILNTTQTSSATEKLPHITPDFSDNGQAQSSTSGMRLQHTPIMNEQTPTSKERPAITSIKTVSTQSPLLTSQLFDSTPDFTDNEQKMAAAGDKNNAPIVGDDVSVAKSVKTDDLESIRGEKEEKAKLVLRDSETLENSIKPMATKHAHDGWKEHQSSAKSHDQKHESTERVAYNKTNRDAHVLHAYATTTEVTGRLQYQGQMEPTQTVGNTARVESTAVHEVEIRNPTRFTAENQDRTENVSTFQVNSSKHAKLKRASLATPYVQRNNTEGAAGLRGKGRGQFSNSKPWRKSLPLVPPCPPVIPVDPPVVPADRTVATTDLSLALVNPTDQINSNKISANDLSSPANEDSHLDEYMATLIEPPSNFSSCSNGNEKGTAMSTYEEQTPVYQEIPYSYEHTVTTSEAIGRADINTSTSKIPRNDREVKNPTQDFDSNSFDSDSTSSTWDDCDAAMENTGHHGDVDDSTYAYATQLPDIPPPLPTVPPPLPRATLERAPSTCSESSNTNMSTRSTCSSTSHVSIKPTTAMPTPLFAKTRKKKYKKTRIYHYSDSPCRIMCIRNELWTVLRGGDIHVLTYKGVLMRSITANEVPLAGEVGSNSPCRSPNHEYEIKALSLAPDESIIVACDGLKQACTEQCQNKDRGIFTIDENGKVLRTVASGRYWDVTSNSNFIFALSAKISEEAQHVFILNAVHNSTFQCLRNVALPCYEYERLLPCGVDTVYLSSIISNQIHRFCLQTLRLETFGSGGKTSDHGCLEGPLLCKIDDEHSLLIADRAHDRLEVLTEEKQWLGFPIHGIKDPYDAVIVNSKGKNIVFVLSEHDDILYKCSPSFI